MTTSENEKRAAEQVQGDQAAARISELLDTLAAVEGLGGAASATGISEEQMRSSLRQAGEMIRQSLKAPITRRWPMKGSILDWRDMTVAEALEILSDHAMRKNIPSGATPENLKVK